MDARIVGWLVLLAVLAVGAVWLVIDMWREECRGLAVLTAIAMLGGLLVVFSPEAAQ